MPRLNAPTQGVFLTSVVIAVFALIGHFLAIVGIYAFWVAILAYVVLAAACIMKGL
jgi:hypothetical protein